jgi:aminopeptidase N
MCINGANKTRYKVWAQNKSDTFSLPLPQNLTSSILMVTKFFFVPRKKTRHSTNIFININTLAVFLTGEKLLTSRPNTRMMQKAVGLLKTALKDKYEGLRSFALSRIDMKKDNVSKEVEPVLLDLAKNDPKKPIKAAAIAKLSTYKKPEYAALFKSAVNDSSYTVSGSALEALSEIDSVGALAEAKRLATQPAKGKLSSVITAIMIEAGDESSADMI